MAKKVETTKNQTLSAPPHIPRPRKPHPARLANTPHAGSNSQASTSSDSTQQETSSSRPPSPPALPRSGFFKLADPNAEVYSKAGEKFDPREKPGRYKSDFIWNTNWQDALKREEDLRRKQAEAKERREREAGQGMTGAGTVSFSRLAELDRMDVDLGAQLLAIQKKEQEEAERRQQQLQQQDRQASAASASTRGEVLVPAFSRRDIARLDRERARTGRAATQLMAVVQAPDEEALQRAAEEQARYEALKIDFQIWCATMTFVGLVMTYSLYNQEVAASYLVGALGGFTYLRLLGKSVDSMAGGGAAGGIASQPRLLIPVLLALVYKRWNDVYADNVGLTLELLPMLAGFFTYKLAVIARQSRDLLLDMMYAPKNKPEDLAQVQGTEGQVAANSKDS